MPAHTPSPHRFLAPNPSVPKTKSKAPSGLRKGFTAPPSEPTADPRDKTELQFKKLTPAKRFVIAPHRRTLSAEEPKTQPRNGEQHGTTYAQLTPRPKPRRKFERVESIEEAPQSSPVPTQDDDNLFGVLQSVEHERPFEEDDDDEILFITEERNKRRRISPPTSPHSEPTTPVAATTHRFLVPPPRTPAPFSAISNTTAQQSVPATTPAPTHHRPTFILPPQPTLPQKPSKPLPEIFSPSRKTQKYIPGGLASTVQSWIIETANTGFAAQERGVTWGREREDGVRLKIRVTHAEGSTGRHEDDSGEVECFPGCFVFVHGESEPGMYNFSRAPSVVGNDPEMRILLAGQGGARGVGGVKIRIGGVVGVRQPMWDVDVNGETWVVGVDWVVLT
ncbi:hypothetical protein FB567DRAFT_515515 [Paraphoma chrysanthemicola]|uniref:Uncharacterized protein n=1 Tax=Paraphoma chrysanthemicola TaxID=798071 RepID=A0A8K0W4A1_9PLEO|nr:hypothetical protein FB567DRAFT_515515 [Paraphoma chrysanthemicola]